MKIAVALDALLARLQPRTPVDAGLAEAGLMIDDALEALVLRALALHGGQSQTDLAAFVAASPRPAALKVGLRAIGDATRRLVKRGFVEDVGDGRHRLAAAVAGRFGAFPRLAGAELADAPAIDLAAAIEGLARVPERRPLTGAALAGLGLDPATVDRHLAALDPPARALADWLGDRIARDPWRPSLAYAMRRVAALVDAALAAPLPPERAFEATWLAFVASIADLLDPTLLARTPPRREELVRRWAWFVGCAMHTADGIEPPLISAAALARLDYRRVQADERALAVLQRAEAAAEKVLAAERARRAEAARAYASGRRE